jgi:hypothetical protein
MREIENFLIYTSKLVHNGTALFPLLLFGFEARILNVRILIIDHFFYILLKFLEL